MRLPFDFSFSCTGEGNGNPLQCSCLETPGDGGACWAPVYGVAQSQTRLSDLAAAAAASINTQLGLPYPLNRLPGALGTHSPHRGCTCIKSGPKPSGLPVGRQLVRGAVLLPAQFSETRVLLWSEAFSILDCHSASAGLPGDLSKPISTCRTLRSLFSMPGSAGHCCL